MQVVVLPTPLPGEVMATRVQSCSRRWRIRFVRMTSKGVDSAPGVLATRRLRSILP